VLAPSGQSAIHLLVTSLTKPGDHLLVCDTITYTTRWLFDQYFQAQGIEVEYFEPHEAKKISSRLRPETRLVFWESPGAVTYELIDSQALVEACASQTAITVMDNSWAASTFYHPLEAGVDISIISLSKSHAAVEGVSLGAIVTNTRDIYVNVKTTAALLGIHVGSDTCASALRSMSTLGSRLALQMSTTNRALKAFTRFEIVNRIFHPSLQSLPGDLFSKNYTGFNSLVSVELSCRLNDIPERLDRLRLIKIGYGWGGTLSLVSLIENSSVHSAQRLGITGSIARFYFGLEDAIEIEEDLMAAFGPYAA